MKKQTQSHEFKYALLDEVKDSVTGFQGVIIRCAHYLTGCDRYLVQPKKLDKNSGAPQEPVWLEAWRLDVVKGSGNTHTVMMSTPLGSIVKDKLTGFIGVVVCRSCSPSASNRISVAKRDPVGMKDEREWLDFDEIQIELVNDEEPVTFTTKKKAPPGGPCSHPAPRN